MSNDYAQELSALKSNILYTLYNKIGMNVSWDTYAFKGDYYLNTLLGAGTPLVNTSSLNLSVPSIHDFWTVTRTIKPCIEGIINSNLSYGLLSYNIEEPKSGEWYKSSGSIKIYIKLNSKTRRKLLCSIDMDIMPIDMGAQGTPQKYSGYSIEYLLAERYCAVYADEEEVLKRVQDIFTIYLLVNLSKCNFNRSRVQYLARRQAKELAILVYRPSTLEVICQGYGSKYSKKDVLKKVKTYLNNNNCVDAYRLKINGVTAEEVLESTLIALGFIRTGK